MTITAKSYLTLMISYLCDGLFMYFSGGELPF